MILGALYKSRKERMEESALAERGMRNRTIEVVSGDESESAGG